MVFLKILSVFIVFTNLLLAYPNYSNSLKIKKIYPMGEKIYKKRCPSLRVKDYATLTLLEDDIIKKNVCGRLPKKYSDALLAYLWEVKRVGNRIKHYPKIKVTKKEKCPICGMFVYKYPRWVATITYGKKRLFFDGVKDMMKYYFQNRKNITLMLVQDYYSLEAIDAKDAYYVLGSNVYGPMGNELVAFKDKKEAEHFSLDHRGKKIVQFSEITPQMVSALDE